MPLPGFIENVDHSEFALAADTDTLTGETVLVTVGESKTAETLFNNFEVDVIKLPNQDKIIIENKDVSLLNIKALSFNIKTEELEFKLIKNMWRYKERKKLLRLVVDDKEIILTENHSLWVERDDGYIKIKAKELTNGDKLIILEKEDG